MCTPIHAEKNEVITFMFQDPLMMLLYIEYMHIKKKIQTRKHVSVDTEEDLN